MILVTGAAGFIGAHVLGRLAAEGRAVTGVDTFNDSYDVSLKEARVQALVTPHDVPVLRVDCADMRALQAVFGEHGVTQVIHLAAQAGVRDSMVNPAACIRANLEGFANVLECCRQYGVQHLVYASSSSVYGDSVLLPNGESDPVTKPASLYAATKASNELMAHSYSHLFGLRSTGLRFFTVYGPWGRPDMAPSLFSRAITKGQPLRVFNHGDMRRDFVYIDDVVQAVRLALDGPASAGEDGVPHHIFNVGSGKACALTDFIGLLEREFGRTATALLEPMPAGDVRETCAATGRLAAWTGFVPSTPLAEGVRRFADWYRGYHAPPSGQL